MFTIFYDGSCPLCVKEMQALKRLDEQDGIRLIDITKNEITEFPEIDAEKARKILHAIDERGELVLGLDAVHKAWSIVGRGWLYAPFRWPLIRLFADWFYLFFARHRYRFSFLLLGQSKCSNGQCDISKRS